MMSPAGSAAYRDSWRAQWLGSIGEIGDIALQRATWLNPANGNPHYSYAEYRCCYFDDLHLDEGYDRLIEEGFVTAAEAVAVSEFHALLSAHKSPTGGQYDHQAILADPKWLAVVQAGRAAADRLEPLLTDPGEIRHLRETSPSALQATITANGAPA